MIDPSRIDRLRMGTATIGILVNPLSGRIRKYKEAVKRELEKIPRAVYREVANTIEINACIDAFMEADIDLLAIVGGDGTVQGVLNYLFTIKPATGWPVLTVVPGGTTNMSALDLGAQGKPEQMLQKLRDSLTEPALQALVRRHVLCIEQGAEKVHGMFFGVGLIARAVIFSQGKIKKLGVTGEIYSGIIMAGYLAGALMGRRHGAWAPVQMSIIRKNIELQRGSYAFLFASTLDRLLFGMRPYWGKEQEPLHVTFVRQQRKRPLRSIIQLLSGRGHHLKEQDGYHSCNTEMLELLIDDDYIVDGESFHAAQGKPLRVTTTGPVTFLVVRSASRKS
jgi:diacylglycerol kinase (ATP)